MNTPWRVDSYTVEHGYTDWFRARTKKIYRLPGL